MRDPSFAPRHLHLGETSTFSRSGYGSKLPRGAMDYLWKGDYAKFYLDRFKDLELVHEHRLPLPSRREYRQHVSVAKEIFGWTGKRPVKHEDRGHYSSSK